MWPRIGLLVRNDLNSRFIGSAMGLVWVALLPLLQLAIFAFVFGIIFKARVPGLEGTGYLAFLALGMWPWFAFSEAVVRGGSSLTEQVALLEKVAIEPWHLVLARTIAAFVIHAAGFVLVLAVLSQLAVPLHLSQLHWVLLGWLWLFVLALAVALLLAVLQVFVRDLQQLTPVLLGGLLFASPILYSFDMLPPALRVWFSLNPLMGLIGSLRDPLLWGASPAGIWSALCVTMVLCVVATAVYRRLRPHLEDFL